MPEVWFGRFLAPLLSCFIVLCSIPCPLNGQVMRGRVLDEGTQAPVEGASVTLLDSQDRATKTVLTSDSGGFVIAAPRTGRFRVRLDRIGYATTVSSEIDLLPPDTVDVEVHLTVEAVALSPLTIISERGPLVLDTRLASWGYYDRRARYTRLSSGVSHFLGVEDIRKKSVMRVTDVFKDLSGIRVTSIGGNRTQVRGLNGCTPTYYLDGTELRLGRGESIDDYVLASHLSAVEVYAKPPYPAQYAPRMVNLRECGSIVLWTGYVKEKG